MIRVTWAGAASAGVMVLGVAYLIYRAARYIYYRRRKK